LAAAAVDFSGKVFCSEDSEPMRKPQKISPTPNTQLAIAKTVRLFLVISKPPYNRPPRVGQTVVVEQFLYRWLWLKARHKSG
jgi:hypothetical protein